MWESVVRLSDRQSNYFGKICQFFATVSTYACVYFVVTDGCNLVALTNIFSRLAGCVRILRQAWNHTAIPESSNQMIVCACMCVSVCVRAHVDIVAHIVHDAGWGPKSVCRGQKRQAGGSTSNHTVHVSNLVHVSTCTVWLLVLTCTTLVNPTRIQPQEIKVRKGR